MAVWWVTEPVPIPVTSFLPMIILPLSGVMTLDDTVVGYANPVIYMYMGGFILAIAMVAVALATTCAFMMPISTPPNAAVFSTGRITIKEMAKAGFAMNIVSAIIITLFVYFVMPLLLPMPS